SYPGSEEAIGETVGHRRNEFVLVSKCGQAFADVPGTAWSEQVILGTIDRSLKRLKTNRLDVMLLHTCSLEILKKGEAIGGHVQGLFQRISGAVGENEVVAQGAGVCRRQRCGVVGDGAAVYVVVSRSEHGDCGDDESGERAREHHSGRQGSATERCGREDSR